MTDLISLLPFAEVTGVYYAFVHSDMVGQGIVVLLSIFSMITWSLMLIKGLSLSQAYKDSRRLLGELRKKSNPLALKSMMDKEDTPVSRVFHSAYQKLSQLCGGEERLYRRKPMTDKELHVIRSAMEESVSDQIVVLEDKIILLMTAVSISPFLGLFGTVWGIMLAFTEMAIQGKPDISTLAPGISGALLTTVLGLVVAIPSLIGYNYITFYIKQITVFMDNFVEETITKFEMEQVMQEKQEQVSPATPPPVQTGFQQPMPQMQTGYQQPPAPAQPAYQQPPAPAQTGFQQPVQDQRNDRFF